MGRPAPEDYHVPIVRAKVRLAVEVLDLFARDGTAGFTSDDMAVIEALASDTMLRRFPECDAVILAGLPHIWKLRRERP